MDHREAWDLLSEYVDGELEAKQITGLEEHLGECRACRHEVEQLRALVREANALPRSIEPGRDLWPAIAVRTVGEEKTAGGGAFERWFGFLRLRPVLWPAAAAAVAVVLVLAVVQMRQTGVPPDATLGPEVSQESTSDSAALAVLEALEAECTETDQEVARYAAAADDGPMVPVVGAMLANLRIIDHSISELREAWRANPDSPRLARMLAAAYRAKIVLQGRAVEVAAQT